MKTQEIIEEVRQLKERLALLENQLKESQEELKEKYVPWIPEKDNGEYWFIDSDGRIILSDRKDNLNSDFIGRLNHHNVFKTKELAEERKLLSPLERKLAFILDQLGRDENEIDFSPDQNQFKHFPYYEDGLISSTWFKYAQDRHKSQYATSERMMEKAIELMGDDAYRYCGVEPPVKE
jgi:hypothetical protein